MLDKISDFLKDHLKNNELTITEQTIFTEIGLDSLDLFQLISDFEEKFDVTLEMEQSVTTVGELVKILENAVKEN